MKKRLYVDLENVNMQAINQIDQLTNKDEVYIFYTEQSGKITMDMAAKFLQADAMVKLIKVPGMGMNALDYRLVALLATHVANCKDSNVEYYVVTQDKGYLASLNILKQYTTNTKFHKVSTIREVIHQQGECKLQCAS